MIRFRIFCISLLVLTANFCFSQGKILIAAASDLKFAMDSLITFYEKNNPGKIEITYGSSGKLTEQIVNGAPFDIFFSADISYPEQLKSKQLTASEVYVYGIGRIVLWSKNFNARQGLAVLRNSAIKKIAIANPRHAPYGKRAEESLQYYKLLGDVQGRLVYGDNISQTAQYISTGAADIGVIALSLALSPTMKKENGNYFLIPEVSHQPLIQAAVIMQSAKDNKLAISFFNFIKGDRAIEILKTFGFSKP
jgi:molybdate transport system substrate-binding protein